MFDCSSECVCVCVTACCFTRLIFRCGITAAFYHSMVSWRVALELVSGPFGLGLAYSGFGDRGGVLGCLRVGLGWLPSAVRLRAWLGKLRAGSGLVWEGCFRFGYAAWIRGEATVGLALIGLWDECWICFGLVKGGLRSEFSRGRWLGLGLVSLRRVWG